ncbi:unannotated protein [freshwater metagenome]|uniref:Unannotated protein n=1 Tax=freshwater metagenome TaxID=449393 RepID=A0A6J7PUP2_9ZZZZ
MANIIHEAIEEYRNQNRSGGGALAGQAGDLTEQLERLEGLRDRGSITQDEFEAQKRRMLG